MKYPLMKIPKPWYAYGMRKMFTVLGCILLMFDALGDDEQTPPRWTMPRERALVKRVEKSIAAGDGWLLPGDLPVTKDFGTVFISGNGSGFSQEFLEGPAWEEEHDAMVSRITVRFVDETDGPDGRLHQRDVPVFHPPSHPRQQGVLPPVHRRRRRVLPRHPAVVVGVAWVAWNVPTRRCLCSCAGRGEHELPGVFSE